MPTLSQPLPNQAIVLGGTAVNLDLRNYFTIPGVTGQVAQFDTVSGKINVELLSSDAPLTVTNFLNYVNRGAYTNTFIHRSVPGFVIQGGGYFLQATSIGTDRRRCSGEKRIQGFEYTRNDGDGEDRRGSGHGDEPVVFQPRRQQRQPRQPERRVHGFCASASARA